VGYPCVVRTPAEDALARRRRGGVLDPDAQGETSDAAYRSMTISERLEAVRRLSERAYAISLEHRDGDRRRSGLPDRLVGGPR
jgi:hypothetical protein